ncbi:MAG: glycosyltransferase [Taibaiella sp.]|nr:glycosyltransferase [Taibaiella sp.]
MLDLSVIVPLLNEEESLAELADLIRFTAHQERLSYEIIFVDDGSTDSSWRVIKDLVAKDQNVKGIKFQRNYGKSAALNEGFKKAKGSVVITMDADLQDNPDEIPDLVRMIREEGYDLVSGWKKKRFDNKLTKNVPSKFFNGVTRSMSGIRLHDFNCGLKAYDSRVIKSIEIYGEMHRYIPVLAKNAGFKKIGEKVVKHQARKYGVSKFGWNRFINGFLDLLTVAFIGKFGKKPMHFFGLIGFLMFLFGFGIFLYLVLGKIFVENFWIVNRPPFFIALTLMIIGCMFFLSGYLAELIVRNASERNLYHISEEI